MRQHALRGPGPCLGLALAAVLLLAPAGALAGGRRSLLAGGGCASTAGGAGAGSYRVTYALMKWPAGVTFPLRTRHCFLVNSTHAGCDPSGSRCCFSGGAAGGLLQTASPPLFKSLVMSVPSRACLTPAARRAVRWYVSSGDASSWDAPSVTSRREGKSIRVPLSTLPPGGGSVCVELEGNNPTACDRLPALCGSDPTACGLVVKTLPFRAGAGQRKQPCCVEAAVTIACSGGRELKDGRCTCYDGADFDPVTGRCVCRPGYMETTSHVDPGRPICVRCSERFLFCNECAEQKGCTSCTGNLVPTAGICDCRDNSTYLDFSTGACLPCTDLHPECKECSSIWRPGCVTCGKGMTPSSDGGCECPLGDYLSPDTGSCQPCADFHPSCNECAAEVGCLTCGDGLVPDGSGGCAPPK
ncbi:hypothetical protein Rsub_13109 [Raphidocelis subcapitata]|uniref:EGF-like domain-containing protein n=1 Tax=Raphidocelis subcapitata TaxID=307507 RepID=A0A2V0PR06_9CHLO|nr:hypothetical protein Rsub_13109 [Raphidocelis subcapitata]|eukprot:GBF99977.1 hypothetical protein Rsub_13109 [Raphidocelis subcapitata]